MSTQKFILTNNNCQPFEVDTIKFIQELMFYLNAISDKNLF